MTDMNTDLEAIADRIQKLLALANNNPNEHEAAAATEKAQALLEAYNLDLMELGGKDAGRKDTKLKGGLYRWQRGLWEEIASLNFCMYWSIKGMTRGSKYEHRLLGREVNVASTRVMAEYLEQTIERLTREQFNNDPKRYFSKAGIAYREGMADSLCGRLRERRYEQKKQAEREKREQEATSKHPGAAQTENALTVIDVASSENDLNHDFLNSWEPGTTAQRRKVREAESERYMEEARARQRAREEADALLRETNPDEWQRLRDEEAKQQEKWRKREERNAKRRKGYAYTGPKVRHESYHAGYDKGGEISLDQQVSKTDTRKIK